MINGLQRKMLPTRLSWTAGGFVVLVCIVTAVNDGWSGRPSPFLHQVCLLPLTLSFLAALAIFLGRFTPAGVLPDLDLQREGIWRSDLGPLWVCAIFEILSVVGFWYEDRHFARFGYVISARTAGVFVAAIVFVASIVAWRRTPLRLLGGVICAYGAGLLLAIHCFPLNYFRSDMLPVICWADGRLLRHMNPYTTMHVGSRLYDFPYLPGLLVAFLPAVAMHIDVRVVNLICMVAVGLLVYGVAGSGRRWEAAGLLGVFLLSPFLQYRHDLYLEPHWLALVFSVVLMQRRRFAWAAAAFGVSMALYQLSWVLFPFLLLYAFRRGRWVEAGKVLLIGLGAMLVVVGPFLRSATQRIASNTVGQWSRLPHAQADPMNLSYWVTFLVRPDQLKWVQLAVMTALFASCVLRDRCRTLVDTLRWMSGALALFIALNVLVDGYFFLTLLLLLLMYTYAATGIWPQIIEDQRSPTNVHAHRRYSLRSE